MLHCSLLHPNNALATAVFGDNGGDGNEVISVFYKALDITKHNISRAFYC